MSNSSNSSNLSMSNIRARAQAQAEEIVGQANHSTIDFKEKQF
jgi:hypothetical protein